MVHSLHDGVSAGRSQHIPNGDSSCGHGRQKAAKKTAARAPKTRPVQISSVAYDLVSKVSEQTGISRAQIIDYLVTQHNAREILAMLKADEVKKRPVGKPKQRFFS